MGGFLLPREDHKCLVCVCGKNECVLYWECPQVDPVSDRRLFCKAHAHSSMVERLGHATELEVSKDTAA